MILRAQPRSCPGWRFESFRAHQAGGGSGCTAPSNLGGTGPIPVPATIDTVCDEGYLGAMSFGAEYTPAEARMIRIFDRLTSQIRREVMTAADADDKHAP